MPRNFFWALFFVATMTAASRWEDEGQAWWKNVIYLSSDNLQGRSVGTHGFELAAHYVAKQFEKTGVKSAGDDKYFQKVSFTEIYLNSVGLSLERSGKTTPIAMPAEAQVHFGLQSAPKVTASVVFAGYGLAIPEIGHNDLDDLPLKGKIVAYLDGAPPQLAPNLRAHYGSSEVRWRAMRAAGAVGMITIPDPRTMERTWARESTTWGAPKVVLSDPKLNSMKELFFSASWNPEKADDLFTGSGHNFAEIHDAAEHNLPLPHFETKTKLNARVFTSARQITSKNVVAVHPGIDSDLKNEYVVVSAHLDHLGAANAARVFHGAMDDASGVSSVIEIAKMVKNLSTKRSILFLLLTGEEKGELGSAYFARYPTVRGPIVADLNMDMFLPLCPLKRLEVQGLDESTLGGDVQAVAEAAGIKVDADSEPEKNKFSRSDQYSFVRAGVPAVAFKFGYLKGDPEEKIFQDWYAKRYHAVNDDSQQPVDLEAAAHFNDILKSLLIRVANAQQAPHWRQDSFFKRFATAGRLAMPGM